MPIVAAFIVPHPPLIVSEVGRGSEKEVQKTIDSYRDIASQIAALKPETVIISSPHAPMYSDCFHISRCEKLRGSFADFAAPQVTFEENCDTELALITAELAKQSGIPIAPIGRRDSELDHGTMVPLYFIEKELREFQIMRLGLSWLPLGEHLKLGQVVLKAVEQTGRRAVYVASGDLSHKLQAYGPYGFAQQGPEYDERLMDVCERGALSELLGFDEGFCEAAAECGHRSFVIMSGALGGSRITSKVLSHEDVTGVGYGVCSFYPSAEKDPCVELARRTIESYITSGEVISVPDDAADELKSTRAGAFVSIHKCGELRGCIGTITATEPSLAKEIISNAISASTRDPRFDPITPDELSQLEINVDVLGEFEQIDSMDELDVKRYGVYVTSGLKRGLLLPDLDGVDSVEQQVRIAMSKGGIRQGEKVTLYRFEVIRHK